MPFDVGVGEQIMVLVVAIMTVALPVAIILLVVQAARRPPADPRAVLADRLARGEITRDEFDTATRALGDGEAPRGG